MWREVHTSHVTHHTFLADLVPFFVRARHAARHLWSLKQMWGMWDEAASGREGGEELSLSEEEEEEEEERGREEM